MKRIWDKVTNIFSYLNKFFHALLRFTVLSVKLLKQIHALCNVLLKLIRIHICANRRTSHVFVLLKDLKIDRNLLPGFIHSK